MKIKQIFVVHHDFDNDVIYGLAEDNNEVYKWTENGWVVCQNAGLVLNKEKESGLNP